ncbi:hypothetical protein PtrM4_146210 [Pyrenophora tritici-repentis]|uniref:Reverse transcriptase Ty1/copia-type domain-containing protein n=1 Tax=Pyrenophora tritici-repentis TaxID=45151 RepID=A0A834VJ55_9PLEO|nr:hypothetical protein PtrM4_146210 [Pyrenophora tritici-repentis]
MLIIIVDCWLINTEHPRRPKTYANALSRKKLDAALAADNNLRDKINKALDKWRAKQQESGGSIAIDDGNRPTRPTANTDYNETTYNNRVETNTIADDSLKLKGNLYTAYDVPNAFLNTTLNRKLYAETPDGFKKDGELLQVLRALYGLKESPLLWYKDLRETLKSLGLTPILGFPCVYVNSWLIMFVYVDDIVMAFHLSNRHLHQEFKKKLEEC